MPGVTAVVLSGGSLRLYQGGLDLDLSDADAVTDAHMAAALDQLLDTRSALTRVLLGGAAPAQPRDDARA
jgi:hypothetical protein